MIADNIEKKTKFARKCFKEKYIDEREQYASLLSEVLYQIRACEELYCPVSESLIKEWIYSGSIAHVERTARSLKFAS